jgi:hypothetical protein
MRIISQGLCFGMLCSLCAVSARATTTFNLSTGTVPYTITSDTNGGTDAGYTGTAFLVTSLPGAPYAHITNPLSNGTSSGVWVGPNANQLNEPTTGVSAVSGTTVYRVTFDLTGYDFTSASLLMSIGADDFVSSVVLNSTTVFTPTGPETSGGMWATGTSVPSITSGFIAGVNTLTFTVANSTGDGATSCCGPTGLIAAVDVFANSTVPEPATAGITGASLLGLAALVRRRRVARR